MSKSFSDFIRNSTDEEKQEVYGKVIAGAIEDQKQLLIENK